MVGSKGLGMVGPQLKYSTVPGSRYRQQTMWRYGFGGKAGTQVSENGTPLWPLSADQNTRAGSWSGYFGTTAKFDADTGFWSVCGENSNVGSGWVGVADSGQAYCESMRGVWMSSRRGVGGVIGMRGSTCGTRRRGRGRGANGMPIAEF